MTILELLNSAAEILHQNQIVEARREASSLMSLALRKDRAFLLTHPEYELSPKEEELFREFLSRRAAREPLQYVRGNQEFYGLDFIISPDVLIPRPETELIVESAIEILRHKEKPVFCEIGTGSGCISIAILHNLSNASAIAVDISEKALAVARKNAENNQVTERLKLKISDVFERFEQEKFDLIVSNPPYISIEDLKDLQPEVRNFEPKIALTDGKDGLSIIKKIIFGAPLYLKINGFLLMEIGFNQSLKVEEMFDKKIWQNIEFLPDLQGIPRMLKAQLG